MSLVRLDRRGLLVTDDEVACAAGRRPLERVQAAWVETRRPGYAQGALMAVLGAALLLRGAGLLKLVGAALVGMGVLRARVSEFVLVLRLDGEPPFEALRTRDEAWAREALGVIDRARAARRGLERG